MKRISPAGVSQRLVGLPAARHQINVTVLDAALRHLVAAVDIAHLVVIDNEIGAAIAALQNPWIGEKPVLEGLEFEGV
jgi:hypothetical protein